MRVISSVKLEMFWRVYLTGGMDRAMTKEPDPVPLLNQPFGHEIGDRLADRIAIDLERVRRASTRRATSRERTNRPFWIISISQWLIWDVFGNA